MTTGFNHDCERKVLLLRTIHAVHFFIKRIDAEQSDLICKGHERETICFNTEGKQCSSDETKDGTVIENPEYELSDDGDCIRVIGTLEPDWIRINEIGRSDRPSGVLSFYTDSGLCANAVIYAFSLGTTYRFLRNPPVDAE